MKIVIFTKKLFTYILELVCNTFYRIKYQFIKNKIQIKKVESIEKTIYRILDEHVSVSRFGDGEFKWMIKEKQSSFEKQSDELSQRLIEVIKSNEKNHIVCLAPAIAGLQYCSKASTVYWQQMLGKCGLKIMRYIDSNRIYYNANITRFYLNDINRERVIDRFKLLQRIWENKNLLIVEGEFSRLGVGNDLFNNALEVKRVLAPSKNAFESYEQIIQSIKRHYIDDMLVLISLGPTATVLAYDLSKDGIWAIDIGHIDVEYEWFLRGAVKKLPIPGKAVNEAVQDLSKVRLDNSTWNKYCCEIVEKFF